MLTAAGVSAPDGNELLAFQTGIWGAFLNALQQRQGGSLDNAWVSFFTYEPRVGAAIFTDWVRALPNLNWIAGKVPQDVVRQGDRILGVRFDDFTVHAGITVDGTELGDLLALGNIPYRWGWEDQAMFSEPSAPQSLTNPDDPLHRIIQTYPVQAPTWVVVLQDVGEGHIAPKISPTANYDPSQFQGAWEGYGAEAFLNYGRLPKHQFMLNWPQQGNDYGVNLQRLLKGESAWKAWAIEAIAHSQNFVAYLQTAFGERYGLATEAFPAPLAGQLGGGAFALHPYYRESRRLVGMTTVTELDILPQPEGQVAALPINEQGEMSAIAIGNYPNDHHYPGFAMPLAPKSLRWGGRWTGTPFALPYEALVPAAIEGFLVCDKNLSVSHIANGATRLQPTVLGLGQAAGMAAALCIEHGCQPHSLSVQALQTALMNDPDAPMAIVPLFDNLPQTSDWRSRQQHYQKHPESYPISGHGDTFLPPDWGLSKTATAVVSSFQGIFNRRINGENWQAQLEISASCTLDLVTLHPAINHQLQRLKNHQKTTVVGVPNWAAGWLRVMKIT